MVDGAIALALALVRDRALFGYWSGDYHPDQRSELVEARTNLVEAAGNFVGADLRTVSLAIVDLVGIRWDSNTRWPTLVVETKIRRASDEDPLDLGSSSSALKGGRRSLTPVPQHLLRASSPLAPFRMSSRQALLRQASPLDALAVSANCRRYGQIGS